MSIDTADDGSPLSDLDLRVIGPDACLAEIARLKARAFERRMQVPAWMWAQELGLELRT